MAGEWSTGACLLANDYPFEGEALDIFKARVAGKSWKEIGEQFGGISPSAARTKFTKLTGITDYKVKGNDLAKLAKGGIDPELKKPKVPKKKAAKTTEVDLESIPLPDLVEDYKKNFFKQKGFHSVQADWMDKEDIIQSYKTFNWTYGGKGAKKAAKEAADAVPKSQIATLEELHIDFYKKFAAKYPDSILSYEDVKKLDYDTMTNLYKVHEFKYNGKIASPPKPDVVKLNPLDESVFTEQGTKTALEWDNLMDQYDEDLMDKALELLQSGKTYTQASSSTGLPIKAIDEALWNFNKQQKGGNLWQAYQAKTTSQTGIKAVTDAVLDARKLGHSLDDIAKASGIPKDTVEQIVKGQWKPSPYAQPLKGLDGVGGAPAYSPPTYGGGGGAGGYGGGGSYGQVTKVPDPPQYGYGTGPKPSATQPPPPGYMVRDSKFHSEDFPLLDIEAMKTITPIDAYTAAEKAAMKTYTGGSYYDINGFLRGKMGSVSQNMAKVIDNIDSAMAKTATTRSMTVTRGMRSPEGLGFGPNVDMKSLVGKVFKDKGYVSTSNASGGVFHGQVRMIIECPPGTHGVYVQPISNFPSELEFLMARETPIMIDSVELVDGVWNVKGRVVV